MEGEGSRGVGSHDGSGSDSGPPPPARVRTRPDGFLIACRSFSVITALASILCIAVNVLSAVRSFRNGSDVMLCALLPLTIFDGIFRCYAVVIALFVVVAETEWEVIMKFWKCNLVLVHITILHANGVVMLVGTGWLSSVEHANFPVNDVMYTFDHSYKLCSGVLGRQGNAANLVLMTRAYPEYLRNHQELFLLQSIASYLLLACGVVYVISGMLCIGMVKRARQKKEVSREQAIKDLEDLERRREELESLLLPEQEQSQL
ncbi:hypothetical protein DH2020_011010 [Rehmannia glutinosa]|uniref:Transmembrane protein n=1 Tax=Rehmannia glutinosa TaxID=99300 RepID=A0ABR0XC97_REHGL